MDRAVVSTKTDRNRFAGGPPNVRLRAMLRAVSSGRAEMTCSCEPDLFIDGIACCDQYSAHELSRRGWIGPAGPRVPGRRVPARLTLAGAAVLDAPAPAP